MVSWISLGAALRILAQDVPDIVWQDATGYRFTPTGVAVSPDGRYAATPGNDGVQIWRVSDGTKVTSLPHAYWVGSLAFSRDGTYLAVGGGSPAVSVWRVNDWSLAYDLTNDVSPGPVAFSPDSSLLAATFGYVLQLRNATDGLLLHSWTNLFTDDSLGGVVALAFSPDGTKLASGAGYRGKDVNFKIWSVPSGRLLLDVPTAQTYHVGFVAFSPDGRWLATAGGEYSYGPAQLWRVMDGAAVRTFPGQAFAAVFSPDGAQLGVIGTNIIAFYGVASGALIKSYSDSAHGSYYQKALAITPDGGTFLRTCSPGEVLAAHVPVWIHSIARNGNGCLLSWTGGKGGYQLQQCTNVLLNGWQNVGGVLSNRAAEIPFDSPHGFYRVIAPPDE